MASTCGLDIPMALGLIHQGDLCRLQALLGHLGQKQLAEVWEACMCYEVSDNALGNYLVSKLRWCVACKLESVAEDAVDMYKRMWQVQLVEAIFMAIARQLGLMGISSPSILTSLQGLLSGDPDSSNLEGCTSTEVIFGVMAVEIAVPALEESREWVDALLEPFCGVSQNIRGEVDKVMKQLLEQPCSGHGVHGALADQEEARATLGNLQNEGTGMHHGQHREDGQEEEPEEGQEEGQEALHGIGSPGPFCRVGVGIGTNMVDSEEAGGTDAEDTGAGRATVPSNGPRDAFRWTANRKLLLQEAVTNCNSEDPEILYNHLKKPPVPKTFRDLKGVKDVKEGLSKVVLRPSAMLKSAIRVERAPGPGMTMEDPGPSGTAEDQTGERGIVQRKELLQMTTNEYMKALAAAANVELKDGNTQRFYKKNYNARESFFKAAIDYGTMFPGDEAASFVISRNGECRMVGRGALLNDIHKLAWIRHLLEWAFAQLKLDPTDMTPPPKYEKKEDQGHTVHSPQAMKKATGKRTGNYKPPTNQPWMFKKGRKGLPATVATHGHENASQPGGPQVTHEHGKADQHQGAQVSSGQGEVDQQQGAQVSSGQGEVDQQHGAQRPYGQGEVDQQHGAQRPYGQRQGDQQQGAQRSHGLGQASHPGGSQGPHGQQGQASQPGGAQRSHGQGQAPQPGGCQVSFGQGQAPQPGGCQVSSGEGQASQPGGALRPHGQGQAPQPGGSQVSSGQGQASLPGGAQRPHGQGQAPQPGGSQVSSGQGQASQPGGAQRPYGQGQAPQPGGSQVSSGQGQAFLPGGAQGPHGQGQASQPGGSQVSSGQQLVTSPGEATQEGNDGDNAIQGMAEQAPKKRAAPRKAVTTRRYVPNASTHPWR